MKTLQVAITRLFAALLCTGLIAGNAAAAEQPGQENHESTPRRKALMNIVFLDDAAEGLPDGMPVRYNHWPEWDRRIPTFQKLLNTFIADFQRAEGDKPAEDASLYAMEIAATVGSDQRNRLIAEYLEKVCVGTLRPTVVLGRSTVGNDHLRLVYVFERDCPPREAAALLAALAEVAPPVFHGRVAERFGPFRAPPTIVFDPRGDGLTTGSAVERAGHRWAFLERDLYLLPHYLLHALAELHQHELVRTPSWLADRQVEPGVAQVHSVNIHIGGGIQSAMPFADGSRVLTRDAFNNLTAIDSPSVHVWVPNVQEAQSLSSELNNQGVTHQLFTHDWRSIQDLTRGVNTGQFEPGHLSPRIVANDPGSGQNPLGEIDMYLTHRQELRGLNEQGFGITAIASDGLLKGLQNTQYVWRHQGLLQDVFLQNSDPLSGTLSSPVGSIDIVSPASLDSSSWNHMNRSGRMSVESTFPSELSLPNIPNLEFNSLRPTETIDTGGVLFEHDNQYHLDLTGHLQTRTLQANHHGRVARGLNVGRIRYFDDMPLVWLDTAINNQTDLPLGVTRFHMSYGTNEGQAFGGAWSLEPLVLQLRRNPTNQILRARLIPAETASGVSYAPFRLGAKEARLLYVICNGTGFEPHLRAEKDGRFVCTLRHGVEIEFNPDGLVHAIRSPTGEHVEYLRQNGKLIGKKTGDGRQIAIRYRGQQPAEIVLDGQDRPIATYEYHNDHWLTRVNGDRETWAIGYDARTRRPNRILGSSGSNLALAHDDRGRLTRVETGGRTIDIEYPQGTNTVCFSIDNGPRTEWLLGPISGPVMPDRAVLLTRSMAGRILQVSKGPVVGSGQTRRFTARETISLAEVGADRQQAVADR